MNVLLVLLMVAFILVLLGTSFYLLSYYVHFEERRGKVIYAKVSLIDAGSTQRRRCYQATQVLVFLGLLLAQAQVLLVPLDVANQSGIQISIE